ncbi:MAG: hypothetical protein JWL64_229 [Frankiales bacterium]|nr:hypothetical protein [Frankiales bacterium]
MVTSSHSEGNLSDMGGSYRSAMTLTAVTPAGPAQSALVPTGAGHRLTLTGTFDHPHWLAFLCAGLAAAEVSVLSGRARRSPAGVWDAAFEVQGAQGLRTVDPVLLARTRPVRRDPEPPVLTTYALARRSAGPLELHVTAPDQAGFLGRLLSRISLLTLLPIELDIKTVGHTIEDRFAFAGMGGSAPDDELYEALDGMLRGFVKAAKPPG